MKNKPPQIPTGSFSYCVEQIKIVFSIAQTMNIKCILNLKCVYHKISEKKDQVLPAMCPVYIFINSVWTGI